MTNIEIVWTNLQNPEDRGTAVLPLPITIGRAPNNHLVLAAPEAGVSRNHALLTYRLDGVQVRDLHSTNGIYMDGEPITNARLATDAVLLLGKYELRLNPVARCANRTCWRPVPQTAVSCPWCGTFLADAQTRVPISATP